MLSLLGLVALAEDAGPDGRLLTDFAGGGVPLRWHSVNDDVMGGRSSGSFRVADGSLVFFGALNTNGGGFASIRTQPAPLALGEAEGIRLRVRGDGRLYTMRLQQRGEDGRSISYRANFRTSEDKSWQEVWLPFRSFVPMWRGRKLDLPPVDPRRIDGLGLMIADKIDGAFRLEVDSVRAYAPFSLKDYRGKFRPLVVLAPKADDERLERQLTAVRETTAAFRDRDMILFVVLEEGQSFAGSRPLAPADAKALREEFDVGPGGFGVRLVGKDGGVKRSATTPFDLAAVYAQIDEMPMRRAEIAARQRKPD